MDENETLSIGLHFHQMNLLIQLLDDHIIESVIDDVPVRKLEDACDLKQALTRNLHQWVEYFG